MTEHSIKQWYVKLNEAARKTGYNAHLVIRSGLKVVTIDLRTGDRLLMTVKGKNGAMIKTAQAVKAEVRNLETEFKTKKTINSQEYDAAMSEIREATAQSVQFGTHRRNAPAQPQEGEK